MRVSRDVVFDENEGWNSYKNKEEEETTAKTFTIIELDGDEVNPMNPDIPEVDLENPDNPHVEPVQPVTAPSSPTTSPISPTLTDTDSPPNWVGPKGLRSLADIYNDSKNVILEPGELLMIAADQPLNFEEAVTYKPWREAMQTELDAIVKNKTWQLTDLPPG